MTYYYNVPRSEYLGGTIHGMSLIKASWILMCWTKGGGMQTSWLLNCAGRFMILGNGNADKAG
jgi:hypothetical protein